MKALHLIPIIVAIALLFGCSAARKTYYFSWRTVETNSKEPADFGCLAIDTTQLSQLQASTQHAPVNFSRNEINTKTPLNEKVDQTKIHRNVKASREMVSTLLKQKKDTTRSEISRKTGDPKKNKFAKLGFLAVIIGILSYAAGATLSLTFIPNLFSCGLLISGFIWSLKGLKSEKRKLAMAGVILGGIPLTFLVNALTVLTIWILLRLS